jgi:hypothetical protein
MYMRRAEAHQRSGGPDRAYVLHSDNHAPFGSDIVVRIADHFGDEDPGVKWQELWRAAVLITITSHLLYNDDLGRPMSGDAVFALKYREFLGLGRHEEPTTVYAQLMQLEQRFRGRLGRSLRDYLQSERWVQLEQRITRVLGRIPPLALYIEGPDAEVRHAPEVWLACQKGLFYFAWHFPENTDLASKIRVVVTIRDLAFAAVLEGDKGNAYGSRVRRITWNHRTARRFLEDKIAQLGEHELMVETARDPVTAWMGTDTIWNARLAKSEPLLDYLVGHTFFMPRDIVHLGNALAVNVRSAKRRGLSAVPAETIRKSVRDYAARLGHQRLVICATELVSRAGHTRFETFSDSFPGGRFARADGRSIADVMTGLFAELGKIRFSRDEFDGASKRHLPPIGPELLDVLWRNRIIGFVATRDVSEQEVFFVTGEGESRSFPASAEQLVLHRALIDTVELKLAETGPSRLAVTAPTPPGTDVTHRESPSDEQAGVADSQASDQVRHLVFVSHATEDKRTVVHPLAQALRERGWEPWVDEQEIHAGDSLVAKIDAALASATFGILVLSPSYFAKGWPRAEMDALVAREFADRALKAILPVWHDVSREQVAQQSPLLAGRLAVTTGDGIDAVADRLDEAMRLLLSEEREPPEGPNTLVVGIPAASDGAIGDKQPRDDVAVLQDLKHLLPAVFEEVVFRLGVPQSQLRDGPQALRAIELIRYVGPHRLADLRQAIIDSRSPDSLD